MEYKFRSDEKIVSPASGHSLSRREWVQRMLAGAGVGIAAPSLAAAHPAPSSLAIAAARAAAPAGATAGEGQPAFFDDHQNQVLIALAERIVPGSTGAQVNRFLDTALSAETQEVQRKFVTALNAIEGECLHRFTKSFPDLSAGQQDEVLTAASTPAPSSAALADETEEETVHGAEPSVANLRDFFDYLKGWISTGYYSSESGMKELGWTGDNFFTSFPGCEHPGGHS